MVRTLGTLAREAREGHRRSRRLSQKVQDGHDCLKA